MGCGTSKGITVVETGRPSTTGRYSIDNITSQELTSPKSPDLQSSPRLQAKSPLVSPLRLDNSPSPANAGITRSSSFSSMASSTNLESGVASDVATWLTSLRLQNLIPIFEEHGFDDMEVIRLLEEKDLNDMGITVPGVRKKLLVYARKINTSPSLAASLEVPLSPCAVTPVFESPPQPDFYNPMKVLSQANGKNVTQPEQQAPQRRNRRVSVDVIDTSLAAFQARPDIQEIAENARLAALEDINIIENFSTNIHQTRKVDFKRQKDDPLFGYNTDLARKMIGTKFAAINILDAAHQWNIAVSGGTVNLDVPRKISICDLVVKSREGSFVILDSNTDENTRLRNLNSNIRFYAGVALIHGEQHIGTFCVFDDEPRVSFPDQSLTLLTELAKTTVSQMVVRKQQITEQQRLEAEIQAQRALLAKKKQRDPDINTEYLFGSPDTSDVGSTGSPREDPGYGSWMDDDVAQGEDMNHLSWGNEWDEEFPMPPVPNDDKARCDVVDSYQIFGTEAEPIFDKLCAMVCKQFGISVALVSILGREEQSFKARVGIEDAATSRKIAFCNYTVKKGATFVVPNCNDDPNFIKNPVHTDLGLNFYAATPLTTPEGVHIGTLCILDKQPRYDFGVQKQRQLEALTQLVMRQIELRKLRLQNLELQKEKQRLHKKLTTKDKDEPPAGDVTFMCTDIEGSTALWEQYPAEMAAALRMHDAIMRRAISENYGYEIGTEGDSFEIAFHSTIDAVKCALYVQEKLLTAEWPPLLDQSEHCKYVEETSKDVNKNRVLLKGIRVRMAIHATEPLKTTKNLATNRIVYHGPGIEMLRKLSGFGHGGQIILTNPAWQNINGNIELLNNPHILDLGSHQMCMPNNPPEIDLCSLYQLLPASLAPRIDDYSSVDGVIVRELHRGRTFPPLKSTTQVGPSYFDAPQSGSVTLVFAVVNKKHDYGDAALNMMTNKFVSKVLLDLLLPYKGYACHEEHGSYMLAFHHAFDAILWCLASLEKMMKVTWPSTTEYGIKSPMPEIQFGIHSGEYEECRAHPVTGHMYYFGATVNRTARIAAASSPGQIFASKSTILELQTTATPAMKKSILVCDEGEHSLKGIKAPVSLCSVVKRNDEDGGEDKNGTNNSPPL